MHSLCCHASHCSQQIILRSSSPSSVVAPQMHRMIASSGSSSSGSGSSFFRPRPPFFGAGAGSTSSCPRCCPLVARPDRLVVSIRNVSFTVHHYDNHWDGFDRVAKRAGHEPALTSHDVDYWAIYGWTAVDGSDGPAAFALLKSRAERSD